MTAYDKGDVVRCSVAFTDEDGAAVDPATVTFKWITGDGTESSYVYGTDAELVKDDTGEYHVDLTLDESGVIWYHRFEGTGTNVAAAESFFEIRGTEF